MEEIGGYFGLECGSSTPYHHGVYVNSGSSAMKYIIARLCVKRLYVPKYTCRSVARETRLVGCEPIPYELDERLMPIGEFSKDDFVVYNNYFGVCGNNVKTLAARYPKLIVDNAQAFYSRQIGLAGFFSPHKFFGIPDGGIAVFKNSALNESVPTFGQDHSLNRVACMLKRMDYDAAAGYADFHEALVDLAHSPVLRMSQLTTALMGNINYELAAKRRLDNFRYLDKHLHSSFPFAMAEDDVPLVYPYIARDMTLRKRLIEKKIYVATYWPDMNGYDNLRDTILPLPVDQRYGKAEMNRILEVVYENRN